MDNVPRNDTRPYSPSTRTNDVPFWRTFSTAHSWSARTTTSHAPDEPTCRQINSGLGTNRRSAVAAAFFSGEGWGLLIRRPRICRGCLSSGPSICGFRSRPLEAFGGSEMPPLTTAHSCAPLPSDAGGDWVATGSVGDRGGVGCVERSPTRVAASRGPSSSAFGPSPACDRRGSGPASRSPTNGAAARGPSSSAFGAASDGNHCGCGSAANSPVGGGAQRESSS